MLYRKSGFPKEGELVLCTVTQILFNSVFVNLDEYDHKAMLHISEVSPGRIRNLRDFVKEGKVIVCVVLRIHTDRGLIDVSLRRVNEGQRRNKLNQIKQEQMAEKIVEVVAKELKMDNLKLYNEITEILFEKYATLFDAFQDIVVNNNSLSKLGIRPEVDKAITDIVKLRIKPQKVNLCAKLTLGCYDSDGVEVVKNVLLDALKAKETVTIKYLGGGNYLLSFTSDDYKSGEKLLETITSQIEKNMKKHNGSFSYQRIEGE
jgi:translation initiation factor 2 subunit 1